MSEERKDFLSRWSQRKLEIRQQETQLPAPVPEIEPPAEEDGEPELTPEEIAALPKVDELTAETDITVFLRKGVPEFLRNAALRRMWSLDPAIRDYVSEAREYAYDWNVPGGVPGNGPLLPSDNVEAMLKGIFGDGPPADPAELREMARGALSQGREPADGAPLDAPSSEEGVDAASQHEETSIARSEGAEPGEAEALPPLAVEPMTPIEFAAVPSQSATERPTTVRPPRHGGAKPV